jgi:hypothetical protein
LGKGGLRAALFFVARMPPLGTGGFKTSAVLLAVAALCGLALSACGGGDDSTASTATPTTAETQTEATTAPSENGGKEKKGPSKPAGKSGKSGSGKPSSSGGGNPKGRPEPASNFETPGGDNSIQEYGEEGGNDEREEVETAVNALFKATSSGNWNEVCGKYLSKSNQEQLKVLSEKVPQAQGKSCAAILGGLNSHATGNEPSEPVGGVGAVRIEGEVAFAIYRGLDGKGYAIPLKQEGGSWKLTALAPTPLSGP